MEEVNQQSSPGGRDGGEEIYEVEKILKKRRHPTRGVLYYVKWRNFPPTDNSWEPASNFTPNVIEEFESRFKKRKTRARPPLDNNQHQQQQQQQHQQQQQRQLQQQQRQQLLVFNPVTSQHYLPIVEEVIYTPKLTQKPIVVTDIVDKDSTITITECDTSDGFFNT